ncbi:hypothetical protein CBS101457_003939 [Exobasidium rhododendri]|nr:hypothetical protein CBS101457_003939 [Exobasidium rhododendri]
MEAVDHREGMSSPAEADIDASGQDLQHREHEEEAPPPEEGASLAARVDSETLLSDAQENDGLEAEVGTAGKSTSAAGGRGSGRGRGRGGRGNAGGVKATSRGRGASNNKGARGKGGRKSVSGTAATVAAAAADGSTRGGAKRARGTSSGAAKTGRGGTSKSAGPGEGVEGSSSNGGGFAKSTLVGGEVSGAGSGSSATVFPLARISRIVKIDKEIEMTSKDAIWTISIATELFIKHLTDSAYAKARLDKKKTITYKELASVVEIQSEFSFLQDVIPQPISLAKALELRQEIEDKVHMREAGLLGEEDEEGEGEEEEAVEEADGLDTAPMTDQMIGDETENSRAERGTVAEQNGSDDADEEGDVAMEAAEEVSSAGMRRGGNSNTKLTLLERTLLLRRWRTALQV